jgi:thiamine pyrophosphokinase
MRVLGVLAGEYADLSQLRGWCESANVIVAADGGANRLLEIGVEPHFTVGDFDSISEEAKAHAGEMVEIEDQDQSDCDKLLEFVQHRGWPSVTLIGAEGSRIDHMLGILQSAARAQVQVSLAYRVQFGQVFRAPVVRELELHGRFSLMPIYDCQGVTLCGARWPLECAEFSPKTISSLSNEADGTVEIAISVGAAILLYDYDGQPRWTGPSDLGAQ